MRTRVGECSMFFRAAGRGDRQDLGALCPSVSMVPGAGDHNTGDTLRRDPAWETACTPVAPAPAASWDIPFPRFVEAAMTPRLDNFPHPQPRLRRLRLQVTNPGAAGIDVGAETHWVAVPAERDPEPVRRFGTCTADLEALATWLQACGVTTVAMESTGVYWIPLYELLEARGLQVLLVDARQVARAPGRPKTDVKDCQWIQRLHSYGLLSAAFRPAEQVVVLRAYLRQRDMLVTYAGQHIQHMQKALEQLNVKLTEVVSDITGVTGMGIIQAILRGERDPSQLAKLRDPRCKESEATIARALQGTWREEHLFALRQALALYEFYHRQIDDCDRAIEAHLRTFADQSGGKVLPYRPRRRKRAANEPRFDARARLYCACGVDLTAIEGIDETTALVLLSEIGTAMSRWPSLKHFCSWLGLCPQHKISGGRILSRRVRRGSSRAKRALRLAARSLHHSKSALGAFFRRIKARHGTPMAITAAAHKLARLVYTMLKHGTDYVALEMAAYEAKYRERKLQGLTRQAQELGFALVPVASGG
jgi:transposase